MRIFSSIGRVFSRLLEGTGELSILTGKTLAWTFRPPYRLKLILEQMEEIGVNSMPVVFFTSMFTGMALALQSYTVFKRFNAESLIGTAIAFSMVRELGPVLTGIIVAGRAGSAMAAELGTMRVTEQIDAMETIAVNPIQYLVVPRFIGALIMLPIMTCVCDIIGMIGGYLVAVQGLGVNGTIYLRASFQFMDIHDIASGLYKAVVFGAIIALVGCYKGFFAAGGAEGVGRATTGSVVIASMLILLFDVILTAILF